jgi:hypothetical protein
MTSLDILRASLEVAETDARRIYKPNKSTPSGALRLGAVRWVKAGYLDS